MMASDSGPRRGNFGVSRQEWLSAALDLLEEQGVDGVRVQRLAARLKVNKSGFYWHFRDREDLLQAMLDFWAGLEEAPLEGNEGGAAPTPEMLLLRIADVVDHEHLARHDAAIRQWAKSDPHVAALYKAKLERRLDVVRRLFARVGFSGDELEMRVRTYVCYVSTERDTLPDLSREARAELRRLRLGMLLRPPASDSSLDATVE